MNLRKTILYLIFLTLLLLPLWQMRTRHFKEPELTGAFTPHERPEWNARDWFNGSYQTAYEQFINDSLGFHGQLVRLRNQFCFNIFHQTNAHNVVIGKDNYLFEQDYIDAHYGTDFIGLDSIRHMVIRTRRLQDSLAARGKTLVVFLSPSKADFFSEYIPKSQQRDNTENTNYKQYSKLLKQYGVNVIDYNGFYQSQKSHTPYPLYAQYGIHWSEYGLIKATDSLMHYIAQKSGLTLPRIVIDRNVLIRQPQYSDYDLGKLLNLSDKPLPSYPLCYPEWHWTADTMSPKPTLTVISDSYYWEVYNLGIQQQGFQGKFWYYNSSVYPESFTKETFTHDLNIKEEIKKSDVILIMSTTPGLRTFSWGAIDNLLKAL